MRWTSLGHAGWLAEAGGLRFLFDPVLGDTLHGGIHLAHPPRQVHLEGLRPDVVLISHAHPDHFDVPSLAQLARTYPDAPVLTADALVAESAGALGFRTATVLPPSKILTLGGATVMTTPSLADVDEWGVVLWDEHGCVWNQVDSVLDVGTVHAVRRAVREADGRTIDVGLVHACPLRETAAVTAGDLGFPFRGWADKLAVWSAIEARALVPASAGFRHAAPFGWRDAHVFPTTDGAVSRDMAVLDPEVRVLHCPPGSTLEVGRVLCVHAGSALATPRPSPPAVPWMPLSIPVLRDPALAGETVEQVRAPIARWIAHALVPAIEANAGSLPVSRSLTLVLDVVLPDQSHDVHTFDVANGRCRHGPSAGVPTDHDAVVSVASSMLVDVIEGRRHWGEPLLAGVLRSARRVVSLPVFFPYWALSYRHSVERWVRHQVARSIALHDGAREEGIHPDGV